MAGKSEFLSGVTNTNFDRGDVRGISPFIDGTAPDEYAGLYTEEELVALGQMGVSDAIEGRMRVKTSGWYAGLAKRSPALKNLVTASPKEVEDLSGEADPSGQSHYMPRKGLLHKYPEIVLLYVAKTCSSHCRYCYRLDLFSGKTGKGLAEIGDVVDYITNYNRLVEESGGVDHFSGEPVFPITEALLSGGDPMVMNNTKLAEYMEGLAKAGVSTIRIGTKELAFFPHRFDPNFFAMLDRFHEFYPDVRINFMVHFTHPDEFLAKDDAGQYVKKGRRHEWMPEVGNPVKELASRRQWISVENQTPIISGVNDDANVLRLLQSEVYGHGIGNHYLFQCREIEGHTAFAIPVEKTLQIFNASQKGLSGVQQHAKLAMSTGIGKLEIIGVTEPEGVRAFGLSTKDAPDGIIIFRVLRSPHEVKSTTQGNLVIAKRDPGALWINDYVKRDLILYDGTGLLTKPKEGRGDELIQLDVTRALKHLGDSSKVVGLQ